MALREPTRTEAKVWLGEFNKAYQGWLASGSADGRLLEHASESLRGLLEREPEAAELVAGLVLPVLFNGGSNVPSQQALEFIELGLQSDRLIAGKSAERSARRTWLESRRAQVHLAESRWFDALASCQRALEAIPESQTRPLISYLRAQILDVQGAAADACLDFALAKTAFAQAHELALPFLENKQLVDLVTALAEFVFGQYEQLPEQVIRALLQRVWQDVAGLVVNASVGVARTDALSGGADKAKSAGQALKMISRLGIGQCGPLDLAPIVRASEPEIANQSVERVVKKAAELGMQATEYESVLCSCAAALFAERGLDPEPMLRRVRTGDQKHGDPLLDAVALGMEMEARSRVGTDDTIVTQRFFDRMGELETSCEPRLESWRIRSLFDKPLDEAFRVLVGRFEDEQTHHDSRLAQKNPRDKIKGKPKRTKRARLSSRGAEPPARLRSVGSRRALSRFVDYLRREQTKFEKWLPDAPEGPIGDAKARMDPPGGGLAGDRLGRIEHALRSWPEALAVILRDVGGETVFICVSGDEGTMVERSTSAWQTAANALRRKISGEIDALELTGVACPPETIEGLCRTAYESWPDAVRELIASKKVLLVCPDHRTGGEGVPYELLHDGKDWIGTGKIVARFPSVRALARSAEGAVRRDVHCRLLALAVPEAEGFDPLLSALEESTQIRTTLAGRGWDAPKIDVSRITPEFLLDRLRFITHMHISAHGENDVLGDHLVLAGGALLFPSDLLGRFFPRMPTIFLNTCSLGTSRYLGGGISHGIAHTLIEIGAPSVIANLLPVDDALSARLAHSFYERAESGFGSALQLARREEAEAGVSPLFWGSTILIGDPRTTLVPQRVEPVMSEKLLDAFFSGLDESERDPVRVEAQEKLILDPDDLRLQAAAGLLQEIASWDGQPGPGHRRRMIAAFRTAWELDHLPTAATIAFLLTNTFDDAAEPEASLAVIEKALELIEPLEQENEYWKELLDRLLVRWLQLGRGKRRFRVEAHGTADDDALVIGQAVLDAQLAIEARALRRGDAPKPSGEENTEREVLWNAIMARRELNFEDMPEIFAFASQVAGKLARLGSITEAALPEARPAIAGFLSWLWASQHVADLPSEMADGQTGSLTCLIKSLQQNWPPCPARWLQPMRQFPDEIKSLLAELDQFGYDEKLYQRMKEIFMEIEKRADALLDCTRNEYPERLPDAAAWLLGNLIQCNTYSYTDGSVPEDICDGLKKIHGTIESQGETVFMPWLMEGFRAVRERPLDELDRWKYGITSNVPGTRRKSSQSKTTKAR
jgi:tetratricopeptide (TPR) repeat protein